MSRIRNGARGRKATTKNDKEWFPTPAWCVWRLLECISMPERSLSLIEPCSGDGAIVEAVDMMRAKRDIWTTVDIRPEARGASASTHYTGDAFEVVPRLSKLIHARGLDVRADAVRWDLCPTNPPFSKASAFLELMLPRCQRVAFLLGSDWYNGPRRALLQRFPLSRMIVIPDRISFDGVGQDQRVYAWCVWEHEDIGRTDVVTALEMAEPTPASVIKAYKLAARERVYQNALEAAGQMRIHG